MVGVQSDGLQKRTNKTAPSTLLLLVWFGVWAEIDHALYQPA
jgi:hypothetical protein